MYDAAPKRYLRAKAGDFSLLLLSLIALAFFVSSWGSAMEGMGLYADAPAKYKWQDKQGHHCMARVEQGGELLPCGTVSPEKLNELRLEWTNPFKH